GSSRGARRRPGSRRAGRALCPDIRRDPRRAGGYRRNSVPRGAMRPELAAPVCEHGRVQRPVAVLFALGVVLLAAGCGSDGTPPIIPEPAPPHAAALAVVGGCPQGG